MQERAASKSRNKKRKLRPTQVALIQLTQQLEERLSLLKSVEEEHARLKGRLRVLEAVLPVKEQLTTLASQHAAALVQSSAQAAAAAAAAAAATAGACAGDASLPTVVGDSVDDAYGGDADVEGPGLLDNDEKELDWLVGLVEAATTMSEEPLPPHHLLQQQAQQRQSGTGALQSSMSAPLLGSAMGGLDLGQAATAAQRVQPFGSCGVGPLPAGPSASDTHQPLPICLRNPQQQLQPVGLTAPQLLPLHHSSSGMLPCPGLGMQHGGTNPFTALAQQRLNATDNSPAGAPAPGSTAMAMDTSASHPFITFTATTAHPAAAFQPPAPAAAAAAGLAGASGGLSRAAPTSTPSDLTDTEAPMAGCPAHNRHPHLHPPSQRTLSEDSALSRPDPMAAHSPMATASTTSSGQRGPGAHNPSHTPSKQQQQQQQRGDGGGSDKERRCRPGGAMEWEMPDIEQEQRYIREHIRQRWNTLNRTLEPLSRLGRAPSPERQTHADPGCTGSDGAASGSQGGRPWSGTPGPACTGSPRPESAGGRTQRGSSPVDSTPCGGLQAAGEREATAQWQAAWQAWVRDAALYLNAHDARPHSTSYLGWLEAAFQRLMRCAASLGASYPGAATAVRPTNLETGAEDDVPPDSFWAEVVEGMRLTPAQLEDCEAALALYRERMGRVLAERRELRAQLVEAVQQLQQLEEQAAAAAAAAAAGAGTGLGVLGGVSATMPSAEGMAAALQHAGSGVMGMGMELKVVVGGGGGGVDASHASLLRTDRHLLVLRVAELAGRMEKNVAAEGHTTALAKDFLGSSVFSRVQAARGSVLSYPYYPDALAILHAAVAELGRLRQKQQQAEQQQAEQQQQQQGQTQQQGHV